VFLPSPLLTLWPMSLSDRGLIGYRKFPNQRGSGCTKFHHTSPLYTLGGKPKKLWEGVLQSPTFTTRNTETSKLFAQDDIVRCLYVIIQPLVSIKPRKSVSLAWEREVCGRERSGWTFCERLQSALQNRFTPSCPGLHGNQYHKGRSVHPPKG